MKTRATQVGRSPLSSPGRWRTHSPAAARVSAWATRLVLQPFPGDCSTLRSRLAFRVPLRTPDRGPVGTRVAKRGWIRRRLRGDRCDTLADRLIETQWDDGGWNCDRTPSASHSSFEETLIPLRGLIWHARETGSRASAAAARRAAEVLLERRLFQRRSTGRVIARDFIELHYPCYWHYDVLFALKVLAKGGLIHDKRCEQAIDLVQGRERADGGFPADAKFWSGSHSKSQRSLVRWGPTGKHRSNELVTADALWVLGRKRAPVE